MGISHQHIIHSEVQLCQPGGHPLSWYNLPKKWRPFLFGPEDASSSPSIIKLHQSSTFHPVRKSSCASLGASPKLTCAAACLSCGVLVNVPGFPPLSHLRRFFHHIVCVHENVYLP